MHAVLRYLQGRLSVSWQFNPVATFMKSSLQRVPSPCAATLATALGVGPSSALSSLSSADVSSGRTLHGTEQPGHYARHTE